MLDHRPDPVTTAREALERAHVAARDANGAELRRSLHSAADALSAVNAEAAGRLEHALRQLDVGALADVDAILEGVRRDLSVAAQS